MEMGFTQLAGSGLLIATFIGAPIAHAQTPSGEVAGIDEGLSLADLLNIKLTTGSFLELDLGKSPISMTTISHQKVIVSGARNLSEALEIYVPGFQYAYNKYNGIVWGMRGVMNDRNSKFIVLVNGHKMNTEARDGFIQESALPGMNEVERLEVLRGPAGLVYGSGAIAGIINIVTRKAEKNSSEVVAGMGTWGSLGNTSKTLEATIFQAPDDKLKYTIYGGWSQSDGQGNQRTKVYGVPSWPYPTWETHDISSGMYSNGSANSLAPSWKIGGTLDRGELSLQARLTRQVTNVGGLMIADPWPWALNANSTTVEGTPKPLTWLGGLPVYSTDDPYNQNDINAKLTKNREYVVDNLMGEAIWTQPFGEDQLKLKASMDANSNAIRVMEVTGLEATGQTGIMPGFVQETSGERRLTAGATYLMKRIPQLQAALGYEYRWDDIGDDMSGDNYFTIYGNNTIQHTCITPVRYSNHALFMEGMYDVLPKVSLGFGGRWDGHTRTLDDGGTFNGKLAAIYQPAQGHSVKAIAQTSTNNATADNYEPNRNYIDDFGNVMTRPLFQSGTTVHPQAWTSVFDPVSTEQLHKIKPERTISLELTSTHQMSLPAGLDLYVSPSASFNMVQDLLAWNQQLYLVQNTGDYDFISLEIETELKSKYFELGLSHVYQAPVNLDVASYGDTILVPHTAGSGNYYDSTMVNGIWQYYPIVSGYNKVYYNSVANTISKDGNNFVNLHTNLTKASLTLMPTTWLSLHTNARIFWGMAGRDSLVAALEDAQTNGGAIAKGTKIEMLDINSSPMLKLDASAHLTLPGGWSLGIFAYNLLAGDVKNDGLINAIRPGVVLDQGSSDMYAIDNTSYAFRLEKTF